MRETASLGEMIDDVLRASIEGRTRGPQRGDRRRLRVFRTRGISIGEGRRVARPVQPHWTTRATCASRATSLFPIRVPLIPSSDKRRADRLHAGRAAAGRLDSQPGRAEGAAGVPESIARAIRTVIKREARERQVANSDRIGNTRRIEELEALLASEPVAALRRPRNCLDQAFYRRLIDLAFK